jgi:DNA-binding transcriptional MocR family regulator
MRAESPWTPRLADGGGPASERLITGLACDIVDGNLPAGARLPAHRTLASTLSISTATVTKAYAALARRGLVRGSAGRGMFVAYRARPGGDTIDLALNAPPPLLGDSALAAAMTAVTGRIDARGLADYGAPGGHLEHRQAVAAWIATTGFDLPAEDLLLCNGAQHSITAALLSASAGTGGRPGARGRAGAGPRPVTVFTEEVTFPGVLRYAELAGHPVRAVGTDGQGMHPAALDRALTSFSTGAGASGAGSPSSRGGAGHTGPGQALVYVTPTLQNPTAATMGGRRRREIVRVARQHDALIIEDDVYALGQERTAPPLAALAPERVYYVTSASKALSPAIRVGALAPPAALRARAAAAVRALAQPVSPVQCELLAELTRTGIAAEVRAAIRHEGSRRTALARSVLGPALPGTALLTADGGCYHGFLALPRPVADAVVLAAASSGVSLTSPASIMADPAGPRTGIRLCLGGPSWDDLSQGLAVLRSVLDQTTRPAFQRAATA